MVSMVDFIWVSRFTTPTFALNVYKVGALAHADSPGVSVELRKYATDSQSLGDVLWTRSATETSIGIYEITLGSADTQVLGNYELRFSWEIDAVPEIYTYDFEIGPVSRIYDGLTEKWRSVVEGVWWKFQDLYDSPYGGPNLQVYIQTNFGRERLAQMLPDAIQSLNMVTQGNTNFAVNDDGFPFDMWSGVLMDSLYVEVLKHLVRSYVEQPEVILGTAVSRVDRRDYMQRWQEILQGEKDDLKYELSQWKMANMGLGNVHVLVSGGAYGKWGPTAPMGASGDAAARGYFAVSRFY